MLSVKDMLILLKAILMAGRMMTLSKQMKKEKKFKSLEKRIER
jgi:hypothetical protein